MVAKRCGFCRVWVGTTVVMYNRRDNNQSTYDICPQALESIKKRGDCCTPYSISRPFKEILEHSRLSCDVVPLISSPFAWGASDSISKSGGVCFCHELLHNNQAESELKIESLLFCCTSQMFVHTLLRDLKVERGSDQGGMWGCNMPSGGRNRASTERTLSPCP